MRTVTYDRLTKAEADELLTTGEAAKLLNSSRQHVVNLCESGDLPFTTVGTHRRVRRGDVELIRNLSARATRDQRRSLWLAYATAGAIALDPDRAILIARKNLRQMREKSRGEAQRWLDEWDALLDGPIEKLLRTLVSPAPISRELRQNSPFAGVLPKSSSEQALAAWQRSEASS